MSIEKEKGAKGLVLSGRGDVSLYRQVRQEVTRLSLPHFRRVALIVKEEEFFDPSDVGFFSPDAVVSDADQVSDSIEKF